MTDTVKDHDANRDPITGEPGAHPVGTGAGAAGGGAAGAVIGAAVGGPVGGIIGGAIGAVAGGLGGKAVAEQVDPTVEDAYWRDNYKGRDYVADDDAYDTYEPAYRYGWEARDSHRESTWEQTEDKLEREWDEFKGETHLKWEQAKHATRDAWNRLTGFDPEVEDEYWRTHYRSRPYVNDGDDYTLYQPAYRYGYEARNRHDGLTWNEAEAKLEREWAEFKGETRLKWEQAKHAVRDAWHRVEYAIPGDADGDGR